MEGRGIGFPGAGVSGGCKPPDMGIGNRTVSCEEQEGLLADEHLQLLTYTFHCAVFSVSPGKTFILLKKLKSTVVISSGHYV